MSRRMHLTSAPERPELDRLLEAARRLPPMTPAQLRLQRISFAYGNTSFDNDRITKEMVEQIHDEMYGVSAVDAANGEQPK
jgi:hypothetical protein